MVSITLRRYGPIILLWMIFLVLSLNYFFDIGLKDISSLIKNGGIAITGFTIITAALSYVMRSLSRIANWRKEPWLNLFFEGMWWIIFVIFLGVAAIRGITSTEYLWLERSFYAPASSGIWAICVILTVVVVFQKYRIRRIETGLFVAGFAFLMLGRSPAILGIIPSSEAVFLKVVDLFETPITKVLLILTTFGALSLAYESLRGRIGGFD